MSFFVLYLSYTITKDSQKMETLTASQFKNYLNTLSITKECDVYIAQDGLGEVCTINPINSTCVIEDLAFVDGDEYKLSETQKQQIVNSIHSDMFFLREETPETEMTSSEFYNNIYN